MMVDDWFTVRVNAWSVMNDDWWLVIRDSVMVQDWSIGLIVQLRFGTLPRDHVRRGQDLIWLRAG